LQIESALRAIVLDAAVEKSDMGDDPQFFRRLRAASPDRQFLGYPIEVEPWFQDAWSWCVAPSVEEKKWQETWPEDLRQKVQNARFDAVCTIDVDGKKIVRGVIFSVPRL
jgi:hypothetical protein